MLRYLFDFGPAAGFFLAASLIWSADTVSAQRVPGGDPPYIGTPMPLVQQMLDLAGVREEDLVYDLGSGDGRIVIAAAERGAEAVGIEYEGWLVELSRFRADSAGVADRARFHQEDIFQTELSGATVVTMYLSPEFSQRLRPRFLEQLAAGTRIVSHAFHMGEWEPDRTLTVGEGASRASLYYWVVPADVDGFWSLEVDGFEPLRLEFHQEFQKLGGEVSSRERSLSVVRGSLRGSRLSFELEDLTDASRGSRLSFLGSLENGRLAGTVRLANEQGTRQWRAVRFSDPLRSPAEPVR